MRAQSHVEKPKRAFTQSTRLGVDLDRNVNSLHVADPLSDMPGEWSVSSQIIIDGIDTECLRSLTTQRMTGIDVSSVEESGFSSNELESRADHSTTYGSGCKRSVGASNIIENRSSSLHNVSSEVTDQVALEQLSMFSKS